MVAVGLNERRAVEHVMFNGQLVFFVQVFLSIVAGMTAGVLGLTGLTGFLFYVLCTLAVAACLFLKTSGNLSEYFDSWTTLVLGGSDAGFLSFVLFWTLTFDVCHIYG